MARDIVEVVRGKAVVQVDGEVLREEAQQFDRVIVDLGAGDGRWIYRLARRHPTWLCIGIDANAQRMRDASSRAGRKGYRGGTRNVWFVRTAVEALPPAFDRLADEIHIQFPWGSLLWASLRPDPLVLMRIARVGKPGATLQVQINAAILDDPRVCARFALPLGVDATRSRVSGGYAAAGIRLVSVRVAYGGPHTSWNRQLSRGHPGPVLMLDGVIINRQNHRQNRGGDE